MRKILVTGCNGQLGRAVNVLMGKDSDTEIINTDVDDLDITCVDSVLDIVRSVKPDAIINCAAYTAVDASESDLDLAYKINAIGPRNLSIAATDVGARLMHISTDYVFDGEGKSPYREFDAVNPQGAYGKTKLEGERFVAQFADRFFIIRTAWLYGDGKNFVKTMLNLAQSRDSVSVVADQFGTPTSASELAKAIDFLLFTDNYGLFHGTCEGSCCWADFTEEIYRIKDIHTRVNRITTDEYPTPAKRPAYSVLDNYMFRLTSDYKFADWHDAIREYLEQV